MAEPLAMEGGVSRNLILRDQEEDEALISQSRDGASGPSRAHRVPWALGIAFAGLLVTALAALMARGAIGRASIRGGGGLLHLLESSPYSTPEANNFALSTLPPDLNPCASKEHLENGVCVKSPPCDPGFILAEGGCYTATPPCGPGTHESGDGKCFINECLCQNGKSNVGVDCKTDSTESCESCNKGYHMGSDNKCFINECFCDGGMGATGEACVENGGSYCGSCDNGFILAEGVCYPATPPCEPGTHDSGNGQCFVNECLCQNGKSNVGVDCGTDSTESCKTCNKGYHMGPDNKCTINECTCQDGAGATGEACAEHGGDYCGSCLDGFNFDGGVCYPATPPCEPGTHESGDGQCFINECLCQNGKSNVGVDCKTDSTESCKSCNKGYHMGSDNKCLINECFCNGGMGATGKACVENGGSYCGSCDDGFDLEEGVCYPATPPCGPGTHESGAGQCFINECLCQNGKSNVGVDCETDSTESCKSCNKGYHMGSDNKCFINECFCNGGMGATGEACVENGGSYCGSCDDDFDLEEGVCYPATPPCGPGTHDSGDGQCFVNECLCQNGKSNVGVDCETDSTESCESCDEGYHKSVENKCFINECNCNGGAGATGEACKENAATLCVSCNGGWNLDGGKCYPP